MKGSIQSHLRKIVNLKYSFDTNIIKKKDIEKLGSSLS